jgi:hypothetical protein
MAELADRVLLLRAGKLILDRATNELWSGSGRHFTVYLNGTAPAEFLEALRSVGIGEDKVASSGAGLETAITRALGEASAREGSSE